MNLSARFSLLAPLLICVASLTGCPQESTATDTASSPPAVATGTPAEQANEKFNTTCATCHGTSGKGDGVAAASFPVKPRDYSDSVWQDSVDDAFLTKVIVEGGPAVEKSPLMPPNPDLKDKPEVVKELVKLIRSFRSK